MFSSPQYSVNPGEVSDSPALASLHSLSSPTIATLTSSACWAQVRPLRPKIALHTRSRGQKNPEPSWRWTHHSPASYEEPVTILLCPPFGKVVILVLTGRFPLCLSFIKNSPHANIIIVAKLKVNDLFIKFTLGTELWNINSVLISDALQLTLNYFRLKLVAHKYVAGLHLIAFMDYFISLHL